MITPPTLFMGYGTPLPFYCSLRPAYLPITGCSTVHRYCPLAYHPSCGRGYELFPRQIKGGVETVREPDRGEREKMEKDIGAAAALG